MKILTLLTIALSSLSSVQNNKLGFNNDLNSKIKMEKVIAIQIQSLQNRQSIF